MKYLRLKLAGLTGMFSAPVLLNLQADTSSYPIYVYGYFVNGKDKKGEDNILSGEGVVFSKDIKIQKDGKSAKSVRWNDYSFLGKPKSDYITFGKSKMVQLLNLLKKLKKNPSPPML